MRRDHDDSANAMNEDEELPHPPPMEQDDPSPPCPGPRIMRSNSLESEDYNGREEEEKKSPTTPDEERETIKKLHEFEIQAGAMYYLVESSWWQRWCEWVGFETDEGASRGSRPAEIDNSPLLAMGSVARLKINISERGGDYVLVLPKEWEHFKSWYGGGPDLARRGIQQGHAAIVELYGLTLKVFRSDDLSATPIELNISKASTVRELKEMACSKFGVDHVEVRIWDYFHKKPYALLDTPSKKLETCQIMENNEILIELKVDGSFAIKKDTDSGSSNYSSNYNSGGSAMNVVTSTNAPPARGVVGLENLGNTCFMNSTLQCLSNCPPLADFFSSGQFAAEINRDNPLGHDGKLAESFGSLMKLMWPAEGEGTISCVAPRAFKYQMGTFRPEFSGYQQHDSSELMNFLLDGLHEDLNRIHQKPYTESVDSDGRPDPVVAKESLDRYKLRNDSKIQDLFLGQFKSTLVCPDCGNVSITFDPYTMISLPLRTAQEEMQQQYRVTFVQVKRGSDGKRHHQVLKLGIPKGANAGKLREALSEAVNVPEERLVIGQMMRSYIYKFFDDSASLDFVKAGTSTLLAYEVEHADAFIYEEKSYNNYYGRSSAQVSKAPAHNEAAIIMYFRKEEQSQYTSTSYYSRSYTHTVLYGEPLLFNHPRNTSPANLYEAIADVLGPDVKSDMFKMYVCDTYGKADRDCVDHLDTNDVNNGMKQKLYIVIEWIDKGGGGGGGGDAMDEDATSDTDQADDAEAEDESLTLERCLELFSSPEKLTKEDAWYCDKCKNHVEATKSMQLWTTPEILVCHLKRFSYSRYYRDKVETPVQFPLENLDLSRFVLSPDIPGLSNMYDLVAVSNHMGSLGCGHYTASGRSCVDGQWYKFNDSSTSRMSPEAVNTGDVYFLFYVRKDSPQNPRNRPT